MQWQAFIQCMSHHILFHKKLRNSTSIFFRRSRTTVLESNRGSDKPADVSLVGAGWLEGFAGLHLHARSAPTSSSFFWAKPLSGFFRIFLDEASVWGTSCSSWCFTLQLFLHLHRLFANPLHMWLLCHIFQRAASHLLLAQTAGAILFHGWCFGRGGWVEVVCSRWRPFYLPQNKRGLKHRTRKALGVDLLCNLYADITYIVIIRGVFPPSGLWEGGEWIQKSFDSWLHLLLDERFGFRLSRRYPITTPTPSQRWYLLTCQMGGS